MDAQQLDALIQRILDRIMEESDKTPQAKAYVLLPEDWRNHSQSHCIKTLQVLLESYQVVAVLPDNDDSISSLSNIACTAILRREAVCPKGEFVTVFPTPSRNRVVKTVLCLQDDFESKWIAHCITQGQPVYMPKETPLFTGMESEAYKKKIEAYYREATAYGIEFDCLPAKRRAFHTLAVPDVSIKKRIITTEDLENLKAADVLRLRPGDVITVLAKERADELGISIIYEQL